ncbi:LysM peptidoglycan-binding domain-containing protein [Halioglobus maricola]|uniref:LysM peptidoglycan-binding domain-containing protein n=1 Tax=Halioglobus maricola TaxID=2601894 RepID=A0A5P9NIA7_9GAMM|nr:peptidoglycan DD-metalloendopeptidase family protein [Halioglobus maricola]QFU75531.1 LysM peptidoglycan-binding domain-containing protein [Halioglobus maricola]
MKIYRVAIYSLLCTLLAACGGSPPAPVEDRSRYGGSSNNYSGYVVQRGDTLYSIAFRYGLDYRRLAAANNVPAPYTIYPGQRLKLAEADPAVAKSSTRRTTTSSSTPTQAAPKAVTKPAAQPVTPPVAKTPTPAVTKPSSKPATTSSSGTAGTGPVKSWRWPSEGKLVRKYSSTVHKGIDIGGKAGDPVVAVAGGVVVYAGTGIVGLGELLIVKHNDVYLSAYGHNRRLLVAEGNTVRAGQKIAEKGSSGTDSVRLHFEIRKEGKPIDPLRLLPRR